METRKDQEALAYLQKQVDTKAQESQPPHDERVFEVPGRRMDVVSELVRREMEGAAEAANLQVQIDAIAPDTDSVSIDFTCQNNVVSIGLTDANATGKPAWAVRRHPKNSITWAVPQNVTIDSIKGKTVPLPIDVDPNNHGGAPGKPFKATVQANPPGEASTTYDYLIALTCKTGGQTTHLVIDPEFIVNKP